MTTDVDPAAEMPRKSLKLPVIVGVLLAMAGGAGGFLAVGGGLSGRISGLAGSANHSSAATPGVSFVVLDPLIVSLPAASGSRHLRFSAQLDVPQVHVAEVSAIKPRIVDVLNSYLRAVTLSELEDPAALTMIRSQMLRRIQIVAGEGRVNDLLIMEFVLS